MSHHRETATFPSEPTANLLLKIAAVLWVIWGLVHMLAGVMTIGQATPQAVQGIADAVPPQSLQLDYPVAVGAIINQHGFNLLWIGLWTTVGALFVWRRSRQGALLTALVGGVTDLGYFLFLDLGGHVRFVPGTLMTLICASAIVLSLLAWIRSRGRG